MEPSRRQFLRRSGYAGFGMVAGLIAIPGTPPPQQLSRPEHLEPATDPVHSATSEADSPYALWQYARRWGRYDSTIPINVVVDLGDSDRTLPDVMSVFRLAGWHRQPQEYIRYAYNRSDSGYTRQHASAAQTFYGVAGRHHVRCWAFGDHVSIQAHEDSAAFPKHKVVSFERTKWLIESIFDADGWEVVPDGVSFANGGVLDHTGEVTIIYP